MKSTLAQARRFLLKRHGLLGARQLRGKKGILRYVDRVGSVQFDPVDVCGKSHELAFLARVEDFTHRQLDELLYKSRELLDFYDKNMCIVNTRDWPCLEYVRRYYRQHTRSREAVDSIASEILRRVHERGCVSSQELGIEGRVDWYWSETSLSRAVLEALYYRGELVVHHKRGTVKSYALAADCLPETLLGAPCPFETEQERWTWQVERRIGAVGLLGNGASDAWLGVEGMKAEGRGRAFECLLAGGAIVPVEVEGLGKPLYIKAGEQAELEAASKPFFGNKRVRLLPPLDCLLWDRRLIEKLFDFSYKWEIYTPEAQRKYAYYTLPVLYGECFAGRVEVVCLRKDGVLALRRFWPEVGFLLSNAFERALTQELERLMRFHGLERVEWESGWVQKTKGSS